MTWTEDRVDLLRRLWIDGLSASQIAAELGGITRNAVIGKVHRLGLGGRVRPQITGSVTPRRPLPIGPNGTTPVMPGTPRPTGRQAVVGNMALKMDPAPVRISPPQPETAPAVPTPAENTRMTILTLTEYSCKWPIGDPTNPDFHFCGRRSVTGLPYCGHHARIAYQPVQERRRG